MQLTRNPVPYGAAVVPASNSTQDFIYMVYECVPCLQEHDNADLAILPSYTNIAVLRDACNALLSMGSVSYDEHRACFFGMVHDAARGATINARTLTCGCDECLYKALSIKHEQDYARSSTGKIYLMLNRRNHYVKIGFKAKPPEIREKTLQAEEPDIGLICTWPGTRSDEYLMHRKYSHRRLRGEWFALTEDEFVELAKWDFGHIIKNNLQYENDDMVQ